MRYSVCFLSLYTMNSLLPEAVVANLLPEGNNRQS